MVLAGIKVPDTVLVRDAMDLSRSASEPFLFNHTMRSWLFGVLLSGSAERAPADAELLAVATILHDLGLTDRYAAENRFEVDGANAARVSEGARHLDAADASCLGCHRASYNTIHRSSQRARSLYDPFGNSGGCSGGRP